MIDNNRLDDILKNVQKTTEYLRTRIPEHQFGRDFLPLICGDVLDDNGDYNVQPYVQHVGGFHHSADIIDKDGVVLFTVPPLFPKASIKAVGEFSLASTLSNAVRMKTRVAGVMDAAVYKSYNGSKITVPKETVNAVETWNNILKFYGREPIDYNVGNPDAVENGGDNEHDQWFE